MDDESDRTDGLAVLESLRDRLVTADFEPGQKLKSAELRAQYRCSASTIREVLFRLSMLGLVTFENQKGFRVPSASRDRQHDLTQFRILLEQEGASRSIAQGGLAWEAHLTAAHHKLRHIETRIEDHGGIEPFIQLWSIAERELHFTLVSACGSNMLIESWRNVYDQFRQQHVTRARSFGFHPKNRAEHAAIVEAALRGDESGCRQAIYDHLKRNL